ncbi:MAG TPA: arylsulfatase [Opitutae bacterium]|nr:arylsulfatase [Opitutae bacterium]
MKIQSKTIRTPLLFGLSLISLLGASAHAAEPQQPNIIIILNDDQGYQDLGCYGSPDIKTPNVDRLASEGIRFTDFYVASNVCSASRAALLTGSYPSRIGVPGVFFPNRGRQGMSPDCLTIAEVLKTAGYATKAVGKWHLGEQIEFLPINQGFDSYYGIPYSNDMFPTKQMKYADDCLWREGFSYASVKESFEPGNGKIWRGNPMRLRDKVPLMRDDTCIEFPTDQTTITRRYADESIEFVTESVEAKQPFFLYLANSMPHTPLFASEAFKGKSEGGLYGDVIEEIDFNTGRILEHLQQLGIAENTIVVFTSDNGPWLVKGKHGGSALPLFEGKMTSFEGGQRVPAIVRWPGHIPAGITCSELATSMDLLPTLAEVAGAKLPEGHVIDGKNILNLLTNETGAKTPYDYFFLSHLAVRSGDWKYHEKESFKVKATERDTGGPTLYNLQDDIGESVNLIREYPEIAERLKAALMEFKRRKSAAKATPAHDA